VQEPILGHDITKEYRTKMCDWMIEVCTSFKCSQRTYFLAVTIFDKYLVSANLNSMKLTNKDVHPVGVISMYIASKFEDTFPLHSKVVSEKIAHGTMS
jgi:cyclin-A